MGIDKPMEELINLLLGGTSQQKGVTVVGTGELGKAILVGKVYRDQAVKKHFAVQAGVPVSHSVNTDEILHIIQHFHKGMKVATSYEFKKLNGDGQRMLFGELLPDRIYLVVLHDIRSMDDWETLQYT